MIYDFLKVYDGIYVCGCVCICLFIVFVWASNWIFEVNVSDNQNCEAAWQDIQAAVCKLKLLFFVFCIWGIDAGTYDGL